MANNPVTHYIIVREDMPFGTICAQIAHAAGESFRLLPQQVEPTTVVILAAKGERDLLQLGRKLRRAGIRFVLVREPDAPFFWAPTALGIEPDYKDRLVKFTRGFHLLTAPTPSKTVSAAGQPS